LLSICPSPGSKNLCISEPWLLYHTNSRPVLEVQPRGWRGHMAIRSGQNVLDAEKRMLLISGKSSEIEPINVNRKSYRRGLSVVVVVSIA